MASTNKTTNYELSQYIGSDKPTYLGDYNGDMLKIDTQMKANALAAATADSKATTAGQNASTALENAATADSKAVTAGETANSALSKATANEADIAVLKNKTSIMGKITDNTTLTATANYQEKDVQLNSSVSIGNKITLQNNGTFIIGANVSKIKVSGIINFTSSNNGVYGINIYRNLSRQAAVYKNKTSGQYEQITVSDYIIDVQENDIITLKLYIDVSGNSANLQASGTYLTIEEI